MSNKVIMFTTKSCGTCRMVKQVMEGKDLPIEIVDSEEQPDRAAEHGVTSVPTFVVEDENGKHVNTVAVGAGEGMKYIQEFERFI